NRRIQLNEMRNTMDNVQAQNVILARIGEIALKGLNRGRFEHQLIANIRFTLSEIGSFSVFQSQSRLWIEEREKSQNYLSDRDTLDSVIDALTKVFGLVSVSPAVKFTGGMKDILEMSVNFVAELLEKSSYQ